MTAQMSNLYCDENCHTCPPHLPCREAGLARLTSAVSEFAEAAPLNRLKCGFATCVNKGATKHTVYPYCRFPLSGGFRRGCRFGHSVVANSATD